MFDLIVLDTYSSRHIIPLDLVTVEYFARVKARSAPDGAVVMNIVGSPSFSSPLSQKSTTRFAGFSRSRSGGR